jgi:hypothetical protein
MVFVVLAGMFLGAKAMVPAQTLYPPVAVNGSNSDARELFQRADTLIKTIDGVEIRRGRLSDNHQTIVLGKKNGGYLFIREEELSWFIESCSIKLSLIIEKGSIGFRLEDGNILRIATDMSDEDIINTAETIITGKYFIPREERSARPFPPSRRFQSYCFLK